jgi:GT2 family glycosyltransferase
MKEERCLSAPRPETGPAVSIVIPVWNKVEYTHACLVRLQAVTPAGTYEVVLVDNGSTDATPDLLAALSGDVKVVRNEQNLGFARACNQGAAVAGGRYLLFLNNDTEPHPGWLEPLVEVLDEEPDVGVVGSKLLFPNGLVQHAGVWVITDEDRHEMHGYHRLYLAVPDDPAVEARADLQVVTGAALAIRRELFEDVDLCLKVRKAGHRVVYEPRSTLTHHESVSGPERFARASDNVRRLNDLWSDRVKPDAVGGRGVYRTAGGTGPSRPTDSQRPALRTDAVHVVGYVGPGGGPNRTMVMAAELLGAAGVAHDVSAYHRAWTWDTPPASSLNGTGGSCGVLLVCVEPDSLAWFLVERAHDLADRYVIALWAWPTPSVPEANLDVLRMAHEFWVPTAALQATVERMGGGSAMVLPGPPPEPSPFGEQIRSVTGTAERLTFTAAVDLSGGPAFNDTYDDAVVAIGAFTQAFGPDDGAALLVGVTGGRHRPWPVEGLMRLAGGHPGVAVLDLDPAGVDGSHLAAAGDCHLAFRGARGFAPAALAAMQAGAPVVAWADAANPGVMSARNSYLLQPPADEAGQAALAAEVMRQVATGPGERVARGQRAGADVRRRDDRGRAVRLVDDRVGRAGRLLGQLARVARH